MSPSAFLPWLAVLWPIWLRRRPEANRPLWMRRSLLVLLAILSGRYLVWRCSTTLNLSSPLTSSLSLLMVAAEGWLLLSGLLPLSLAWRRFADDSTEADALQARLEASGWEPWVDILIPTCGEPLPVLERCLLGCSNLDYPHYTIWVLDDGGRAEVAELASAYKCRYHHRPKRDHAKAGNLNAGLTQSNAELVAVFDADFIPQEHFLKRTVGFLLDRRVGLVQTPQHFLNPDPLMRNLRMEEWLLPDEESFYRWIQPVRTAWGAVVCAGTSFVARRAALEEIGGFVEPAISEDLVTGIKLAAHGWQLRYVNEKLSAGLAAETIRDFVRQRQRWAAGTLQALHLPEGPLRQKGLSWKQRFAYTEGALHWLNMIPRGLLVLMPLCIGLLCVMPIRINSNEIAEQVIPLWGTFLFSTGWLNRGSRHALLADLPNWVLTVPLASTVVLSLLGKVPKFRITPKHVSDRQGGISMALASPLVVLLVLHIWNLAIVISSVPTSSQSSGLLVSATWSMLTILGLATSLLACYDPECNDPTPWFSLEIPAMLQTKTDHGSVVAEKVMITSISEKGALIKNYKMLHNNIVDIALTLDAWCCGEGLPTLKARQNQQTPTQIEWDQRDSIAVGRLRRWLYCRPGAWPNRQATVEWRAWLALIGRLIKPRVHPKSRPRSAVLQQLPRDRRAFDSHTASAPVSAS